MLAEYSDVVMEPAGASLFRHDSTRNRDEALPPYEMFDPLETSPLSAPSVQSPLHSPLPPLSSEQENGVLQSSSESYFPPSPRSIPARVSIARRPVPSASASSSHQQPGPSRESPKTEVIAYFIPYPRPHVTNLAYVDIPEQFLIYMLPQLPESPSQKTEDAKKAEKARQKQLKEVIKTASKAKSADTAFLSRFPDYGKQPDANGNCALEVSGRMLYQDLTIVCPSSAKSNEKEIRRMFMNCLIEWGEGLSGNAAKMSKTLSRRLTHNCICGHHEHERLNLTIKKSAEMELLSRYLAKQCREQDQKMFPHPGLMTPTEQGILGALGWEPADVEEGAKKAKDWESIEMQGDVKGWMKKGAKEWAAICQKLSKDNP